MKVFRIEEPDEADSANQFGAGQSTCQKQVRFHGLTEQDWNFAPIQARQQLQACLLYEMARESPLVREQIGLWRCGPPQDDAQKQWWLDVFNCRPTPHFAYVEQNWSSLIWHWTQWAKPPAWMELSVKSRSYLVSQLCGRPAIWTGGDPDVAMIRDSLRKKWKSIEAEARLVSDDGLRKEMAIAAWPEASTVRQDGTERVVLAIDWASYDEPAIIKAFGQWLVGRRPGGVQSKTKTRQGNDPTSTGHLRDWLNALGAARLSAKFTPRQLFDEWPEAWQFLGGGNEYAEESREKVKRRLLDGRKTFGKKFNEFFMDHGEPACLAEFAKRRNR